jgi:hypothetical protein
MRGTGFPAVWAIGLFCFVRLLPNRQAKIALKAMTNSAFLGIPMSETRDPRKQGNCDHCRRNHHNAKIYQR